MAPAPPAAKPVDLAAFADEVTRAQLVPADRLGELLAGFRGATPAALADHLVAGGALTRFQADRVLAGGARSLAVGPYLLSGVHGRGPLGRVYRAAHRSQPGAFAVTVLPLRSLWQAKQGKPHARALAALPPHPALAPLIDVDSAGTCHYLVWPLTDGPTLADRVRDAGPLPPHEAALMLARLADALAACHARGVAHGLVTPASVALAPAGARLLDFGAGQLLAQNLAAESLFDTLTLAVAVAGLFDYAAPEALADHARPTPAADQYALGAVGYFALTGGPPYPDGGLTSRLTAAAANSPRLIRERNPDVPPELATLIDRMLRPDPAERYGGLDVLREVLPEVAARIDPARPVLIRPGSGSLAAAAAAVPDESPGAIDFGHLASGSGISWDSPGGGGPRPPERDDTDASIRFDLPDAQPDPAWGVQPVETPRLAEFDTHPIGDRRAPAPAPPAMPTPADPPASGEKRRNPLSPTPPARPALRPITPPPPAAPLPTPVQWHRREDADADADADADLGPEPAGNLLWRRLRRKVLFWQRPTDRVQVSVFGPPAVTPGQTTRLTIFLHSPETAESVRTLCRALQHDAELLGTGHLAQEVPRGADLAVHVAVTNAGLSRSLVTVDWSGQPRRVPFELHVPWESPSGPAPGLVSVGRNDVRIGRAAFGLQILPRPS